MSIIRTVPAAEAEGYVAKIYAGDEAMYGYVASHTKLMTMNPEAYAAWQALVKSIASGLGLRRYELVTLAAARGIRSKHCLLAHGLRTLAVIDEPQLLRIANDYRDAELSPAEVAMMEYAEKLSVDASTMTNADSQRLRDHGFSDREIVDITLAAAARNFYSRAIQALAAEVEDVPGVSQALAEALLSPTR